MGASNKNHKNSKAGIVVAIVLLLVLSVAAFQAKSLMGQFNPSDFVGRLGENEEYQTDSVDGNNGQDDRTLANLDDQDEGKNSGNDTPDTLKDLSSTNNNEKSQSDNGDSDVNGDAEEIGNPTDPDGDGGAGGDSDDTPVSGGEDTGNGDNKSGNGGDGTGNDDAGNGDEDDNGGSNVPQEETDPDQPARRLSEATTAELSKVFKVLSLTVDGYVGVCDEETGVGTVCTGASWSRLLLENLTLTAKVQNTDGSISTLVLPYSAYSRSTSKALDGENTLTLTWKGKSVTVDYVGKAFQIYFCTQEKEDDGSPKLLPCGTNPFLVESTTNILNLSSYERFVYLYLEEKAASEGTENPYIKYVSEEEYDQYIFYSHEDGKNLQEKSLAEILDTLNNNGTYNFKPVFTGFKGWTRDAEATADSELVPNAFSPEKSQEYLYPVLVDPEENDDYLWAYDESSGRLELIGFVNNSTELTKLELPAVAILNCKNFRTTNPELFTQVTELDISSSTYSLLQPYIFENVTDYEVESGNERLLSVNGLIYDTTGETLLFVPPALMEIDSSDWSVNLSTVGGKIDFTHLPFMNTKIKEVTFPSTMTGLIADDFAFEDSSLEKITFTSKHLDLTGGYAAYGVFEGTNLKEVVFDMDELPEVDKNTFAAIEAAESGEFKITVKNDAQDALLIEALSLWGTYLDDLYGEDYEDGQAACHILGTDTVSGTSYYEEDGYVYDSAEKKILYRVPNDTESVTVPATVEKIAANALADREKLHYVTFEGENPPAIDSQIFGESLPSGVLGFLSNENASKATFAGAWDDIFNMDYGEDAAEEFFGAGTERLTDDFGVCYEVLLDEDDEIVEMTLLRAPSDLKGAYEIGPETTKIASGAFSGCSSLNMVYLSDKLTEVGENAFSYCSGLEAIVLKKDAKVPEVDNSIGAVNEDKLRVYVPADQLSSYQGTAWDGEDEALVTAKGSDYEFYASPTVDMTKSGSVATTKTDTQGISSRQEDNAVLGAVDMSGNNSHEPVVDKGILKVSEDYAGILWVAEDYQAIADYAASGTSVSQFSIEGVSGTTATSAGSVGRKTLNGFIYVGDHAFEGSKLAYTQLLYSVQYLQLTSFTYIGESAFKNCTSLKGGTSGGTAYMGMAAEGSYVGTGAFYGCSSLVTVYDYAPVLGVGQFESCTKLKTMRFYNPNLVEIPDDCFKKCTALTTAYFYNADYTKKLERIGDRAFSGCTAFTITPSYKYSLGSTNTASFTVLASIGEEAFANTKVTSYTFNTAVKSIGDGCFSGCPLTSLKFLGNYDSESPITMGDHIFGNSVSDSLAITVPADAGPGYWKSWHAKWDSEYGADFADDGFSYTDEEGQTKYSITAKWLGITLGTEAVETDAAKLASQAAEAEAAALESQAAENEADVDPLEDSIPDAEANASKNPEVSKEVVTE